MYDYVLQYGFDSDTQNYIQSIKDYLKTKNINDEERNWLPHITIDLYNCKNQQEFIDKVDNIVSKLNKFNLEFKNLNNFDKETLYIEPYNKELLMKNKSIFDCNLDCYRLEHRKQRLYRPHATLCTNDIFDKSIALASKKFSPFVATVKYIWVYNQKIDLIKEYELK